jgi:cytochrome c oxidase subunit 2
MSPWWFTPIASNWGMIDDTISITFWVTGIVFIAVNLFMAYAIIRFRHRHDRRAQYEPENKKLEWWLISLTSVGVAAMLAPGLFVWAKFVDVPEEAMIVEALGEQWRWSYRFAGNDGVLGTTDIRHISASNPFGMNPDDPKGQDDVLISSPELHLPLDKPVKVLLRSKDVLHNFAVPQFRVKMDAVPGMVTYLWFTPTRTGQFDLLCEELCGVGHYSMRGRVIVDEEADFDSWLAQQSTYAGGVKANAGATPAELGHQLAESRGCLACHSADGKAGIGPTWKGLYGKTETLVDGSEAIVDEDYLKESISDPNAKIVQGFAPIMAAYSFNDEELDALIAYVRELSDE